MRWKEGGEESDREEMRIWKGRYVKGGRSENREKVDKERPEKGDREGEK